MITSVEQVLTGNNANAQSGNGEERLIQNSDTIKRFVYHFLAVLGLLVFFHYFVWLLLMREAGETVTHKQRMVSVSQKLLERQSKKMMDCQDPTTALQKRLRRASVPELRPGL